MEYIVKLINDARRVDAVNAVINLVGTLFSDSKSLLSDKNQIFLLFPLSVSFPTPLGIFHAYTKPEREKKKRRKEEGKSVLPLFLRSHFLFPGICCTAKARRRWKAEKTCEKCFTEENYSPLSCFAWSLPRLYIHVSIYLSLTRTHARYTRVYWECHSFALQF